MSKRFWNWVDGNEGRTLYLDGPIAEDTWFGDEVTPKQFKAELNSKDGDVTIWINSPGGDVFCASQIYNMLMDYKGKVTVKIDGLAASAASVIAMAGGSNSEIRNVRINRNRKDYRNRQYIRGGQDVTLPMTERPSPKPDGQTRTFTLKFPVAKVPVVKVNGVTKTVGIRQLDTGKDWYWQKDDKNITQDTVAAALADTDILEVTYQGLFPIIVVADDTVAIGERIISEGGTGLYESVEQQAGIDNRDFAIDFAKGKLRKYAKLCTTVTYDTFATDISVGMLQIVNLPEHKISDSFLVSSIEVSDVGNLLNYRVTLISGEELGGWVNFFKKLTNQQTYVIRENEILIKLLTLSDIISQPTLTESVSWSLHDYPLCGPGIICGTGVII